MDLLSIIQSLWRHKFVTIPVVVLTAMLALYVVKIKPPSYQSTASVLLANPQGAATESQIAENPRLKKVNPYNTFTSYGDLTVVADTVIQVITGPAYQQTLTQAGVDPRYQMTVSTAWGNPPIINITGIGATSESANQSAVGLVNATKASLYNLQKSQGIDGFYMITAVVITPPNPGQRSSSGKLRSLIAVLGLGILLLFVAVSVTDAIEKRRKGSSDSASTPISRYARDRSGVGAPENGHTRRTRVR
jgi:capsular polysaccharide biosynthesis protein